MSNPELKVVPISPAMPDNTMRLIVAVVTIVGTVISSNGWVDFRAMERNEELLKMQQVKIAHIDGLITEIREIHNKREQYLIEDREEHHRAFEELKKACHPTKVP